MVEDVLEIYPDDVDIGKLVGDLIKVIGTGELPLPEEDAQGDIFKLLSNDTDAEP